MRIDFGPSLVSVNVITSFSCFKPLRCASKQAFAHCLRTLYPVQCATLEYDAHVLPEPARVLVHNEG